MIFYISDTHFGDQKVFDKCRRPFSDLQEMQNAIIKKWKRKVKADDDIYVLGDLVDTEKADLIEVFRNLPGKKHLLVGNHDLEILSVIKNSKIFISLDFIKLIEDSNHKICLCHFPLMDWMEFNRNGYHIFGHVHNKSAVNGIAYAQIKQYYLDKLAFNASVDICNFEPKTLDELIKLKKENINDPYIY